MTDANDEALLRRLIVALSAVPGVEAIALGGSRARGTAVATSDYDIGLYYRANRPIDVAALGKVAAILDDRGVEASVTPIGGWGPWIDGGGWLVVGGVHVDLLYRDLDRVGAAIDDAHAGKVERFYQPGHPHAFLPTIYMGEAACARLLHDPAGTLAALQRRTTPYPAALAGALRERFEWEAEFALANARKSLDRGDVSYLAGCAFRAIACLCQTLFALNGRRFPVFESTRPISGLSPASMSYPSRSPDFGSSRPMATHMRTSNPSRTRFAVAVLTPIARTGTARNIGRMAPFAISRYLHSGSALTAF
jgi:predicted nucleotidyltransferase